MTMLHRIKQVRLTVLILGMAACEPGEVTQVDPSESGTEIPSVPRVNRTALIVHAAVDSVDGALADSLGWRDGIPGAEIHVLRNGTASWVTRITNSAGTARFKNLLPGLYRVFGGRTLTEGEAKEAGSLARAFGDGRTIRIGGETELELTMLADRSGSLVISEIGRGTPPDWETNGSYLKGLYFEIYNNSHSTMFLDGKIFGAMFASGFREVARLPCAVSEQIRTDPAGIHVRWMLQFPGSGSEYAVPPGGARTVAVAAIDHTPVHPTLLDLTNADFEIGQTGSANNPAVPDMLDIGLAPFPVGVLVAVRDVFFLSDPVDVSSLPVLFRDPQGREYVRVPRDKLLDVMAVTLLWPDSDARAVPCLQMVHRDFDRYEGGFIEIGFGVDVQATVSLQRKVLRTGADGLRILQDANTSAVDFFVGGKTPGWIP